VNVVAPFPRRHAVSAHEFLEMGNAGIFSPDMRLELIDGEIIEMSTISSPHAAVLRELTALFSRATGDRAVVSPQCPLVLGEISVPQPDFVLLKPKQDRYFGAHPHASDALLVVEVSETSIRFDLEMKVPRYARAGVPEVRVVDIERHAIRVFRHPDPVGYRSSFTVAGDTAVSPEALRELTISPQALFPI
jgi:Uma2 family endonuclease